MEISSGRWEETTKYVRRPGGAAADVVFSGGSGRSRGEAAGGSSGGFVVSGSTQKTTHSIFLACAGAARTWGRSTEACPPKAFQPYSSPPH
jgi:hypothetical protein